MTQKLASGLRLASEAAPKQLNLNKLGDAGGFKIWDAEVEISGL